MTLTRRDFGRIAASTLAAQTLSPLAGAQSRKIGYCIVGLGVISMGHFMPAIANSGSSRITGLVSGHRDKALRIAKQYGVPESSIYTYDDFEKIGDNPEIDAVYIALPNGMHAEYTIRSARAGKHVLCEKPMSTTVADARRMIEACRAANRKLMIEYRCLYEPMNLRAVQILRSGALGTIQGIQSANGFNIKPGAWRTNKKLAGGGPLMDVGIYCLSACRYLTGEEPSGYRAFSSVVDRDGRFDQVEENVAWTMKFPSGAVTSCNTTYGAPMPGIYRVYGSRGVLEMSPSFGYQGQHLNVRFTKPKTGAQPADIDETSPLTDPAQFLIVADAFAKCIWDNSAPRASGEEGLRDMQGMEAIYQCCGLTMG